MYQAVFFLEERSAQELLDRLLPRILPADYRFLTIRHQGKQDLCKSVPIKLRAWQTPDTRFIILHDQDSNDCFKLKQSLQNLCAPFHRHVLIRISCHELEAWYWGDLGSVERAYPGASLQTLENKAAYRRPDQITRPADELSKHLPQFSKVDGARRIAEHLCIENNRSPSFNAFITGVRKFCLSP